MKMSSSVRNPKMVTRFDKYSATKFLQQKVLRQSTCAISRMGLKKFPGRRAKTCVQCVVSQMQKAATLFPLVAEHFVQKSILGLGTFATLSFFMVAVIILFLVLSPFLAKSRIPIFMLIHSFCSLGMVDSRFSLYL